MSVPLAGMAESTGWAKVGVQLWVCKTQSSFVYYYWLIIVLFSIWTTVNLLLPHPVYSKKQMRKSWQLFSPKYSMLYFYCCCCCYYYYYYYYYYRKLRPSRREILSGFLGFFFIQWIFPVSFHRLMFLLLLKNPYFSVWDLSTHEIQTMLGLYVRPRFFHPSMSSIYLSVRLWLAPGHAARSPWASWLRSGAPGEERLGPAAEEELSSGRAQTLWRNPGWGYWPPCRVAPESSLAISRG